MAAKKSTQKKTENTTLFDTVDAKLYARMSEPYATKAEASEALNKFLAGVSKLREEFRVAEVMVMASNYHDVDESTENKDKNVIVALTLGNSEVRAFLAAAAYQTFTLPEVMRAQDLIKTAMTPTLEDLK